MVINENTKQAASKYRVVLTKRGGCSVYTSADALHDLMGYSQEDSMQLVKRIPVSIGEDLTLLQARFLTRALVEYGMSAEIHDTKDEYVFQDPTHETVFNLDGRLIRNVQAVLAGIRDFNRVTIYRRYQKPALFSGILKVSSISSNMG